MKRFSRGLNECPEGVLGGLDSAAESSLSDDESEADSKGLIGVPHHCKSIFHLLIATPFNTLHFSSFSSLIRYS